MADVGHGIGNGFEHVGNRTGLPDRRPEPAPDTVTRHIHRLIDQPIRKSIIERYGLTRVPGSVYYENGEVA